MREDRVDGVGAEAIPFRDWRMDVNCTGGWLKPDLGLSAHIYVGFSACGEFVGYFSETFAETFPL